MGDARTLTHRIVAHCRAGFEPEVAADLRRVADHAEAEVEFDAPVGRGFVVATPQPFDAQRWPRALREAPPVFVRALFFGSGPHTLFDPALAGRRPDRVGPLAGLIESFRAEFPLPGTPRATRGRLVFGSIRLETADTSDGKELSGLCRAIEKRCRGHARSWRARRHARFERPALHTLLVDSARLHRGKPPAWAALGHGVPRLGCRRARRRARPQARGSVHHLLGDRELEHAGMRDRSGRGSRRMDGQLAHRGLRVTAVDGGLLKGEVAHDPLRHAPARRRLAVRAASARRLARLRHCRAAAARRRACRPVDRRGYATRDLQPRCR